MVGETCYLSAGHVRTGDSLEIKDQLTVVGELQVLVRDPIPKTSGASC